MWGWIKNLFKSKTVDDSEYKKGIIRKIINCFEQGKPEFQHHKIDNFRDGVFPGSSARQLQVTVSYGLTQTGVLPEFIKEYISIGGKFANQLKPYADKVAKVSLSNDLNFQNILKKAALEDKTYVDLIEDYFDRKYLNKALKWSSDNGFKTWLGKAVIADSFIHSGSILPFLRNRFPDKTPANGGEETKWLMAYLTVRKEWLKNHSDPILKKLWTRPQFYINELVRGNLELDKFPITPNGVKVNG